MPNRVARVAALASSIALISFSAHAQLVPATSISAVVSEYPMAAATISGTKYQIQLTVYYPTNLAAGSYIAGAQLTSDMAGFFSTYTPLTDPPEAQLTSALNNLLAKYPQMTGGFLAANTTPTVSPTGVNLGAAISVAIGTYATPSAVPARPALVPQATRIVRPLVRPVPAGGN